MREIVINKDLCVGCGTCVPGCLGAALEVVDGLAAVDRDKCLLCGVCVDACPTGAISLIGEEPSREDTTENDRLDPEDCRGVWVFAETGEAGISDAALELLSAARPLAEELGEALSAVVVGRGDEDMNVLIRYGARKVYSLENDAFGVPDEELSARLLTGLIRKKKPSIVLCSATPFGRAMAPRVAAALKTGLTADCTELGIDKKDRCLLQTRPAFGGNVMATIVCPDRRPQMATVRPRVFKKSLPETEVSGEIERLPVIRDEIKTLSRLLEVRKAEKSGVRLEDAEIVVAAGAGIRSPEAFRLVEQLAEALGGVVGVSRAAVDLGYAPVSSQVGQTGKVIAPKLYVACGISGAIQHLVGMENSDFIVAINSDPEAPIFQAADMRLVGDAEEILPALIKAVQRKKEEVSE